VDEQPIPYENPMQDSIEMREKLASAYDGVSSTLSSLEVHYTDVLDHLAHEVKQAALGGASLGEIVTAWSVVSDEPTFVKAAFEQLTPRLLDGGVFPSRGAIGESLTKTASFTSGTVNTDHPLIRHYGEFCETLSKLAQTRAVQQELYEGLNNISAFIQKLAAGPPKGLVGEAWKGLGIAAEHAGRGGERAGALLFGKGSRGAKATGTAAKWGVKAGVPLYVGGEAHQQSKRPGVRRAIHTVKTLTPGTPEYTYRGYLKARGA
jgi:hypothetical protein